MPGGGGPGGVVRGGGAVGGAQPPGPWVGAPRRPRPRVGPPPGPGGPGDPGRAAACREGPCSGNHAEVSWIEPAGGYVLRDLSTNGTFCEKERPPRHGEVALRGGETVSFVSGLGGDISEDGVVRFRVELVDLEPSAQPGSRGHTPSRSGRARGRASAGASQLLPGESARKRPTPGKNPRPVGSGEAGGVLMAGQAEAKAMAALERANRELRQKLELERSRAETLNMELQEVTMKTGELREEQMQRAHTEEATALRAANEAKAVAEQLAEALAQAETARSAAAAERQEREAAQKAARAAHREIQAKEAQIAHLELSLETEVARTQEKHTEAKSVLLAAEARLDQVVMEAREAGAQAEAVAQKLHALSDAAERARGALQDWEQNIPMQPQTQLQGEPPAVANTQFQHASPAGPGCGPRPVSPPAVRAASPPQPQPQAADLDQTEELPASGIAGGGDRPMLAEEPAHPVPGVPSPLAPVALAAAPSSSPGAEVAADPVDAATKPTPTRVLSQGAGQTLNASQGDACGAAERPLKEAAAGAPASQDAATDMDVENVTPVEGA